MNIRPRLTIIVRKALRGKLALSAEVRRRATRMLAAAARAEHLAAPEVTLLLTDDAEIHALNRQFRKKDRPTDVLAFSLREGEAPALDPSQLGDVVISLDTAKAQSRARKHSLVDEIAFLWAHGLCHLLGYDHRTDAEEATMNGRMRGLVAEGLRTGRISPA